MPHVVIVGCGFGGLSAARRLKRAAVRVTLIDRANHHLFQPLLYQVATGGLSGPAIAAPIRRVLRGQINATMLMADVCAIEPQAREVALRDGRRISYDYLVLATGATHSYFGNERWAVHAPGLKTLDDALEIRRRILLAFERAELEDDDERRRPWLTFVVIGGGPTGVELAGTLAEIARHTLRGEFRRFDPKQAKVLLLEGGERVLSAYPPDLSQRAAEQLRRLGVTLRTGALASDIDEYGVRVGDERIEARTVLWAAGVAASPLGRCLNVDTDRAGRVPVEPDLSVPGHPEIFVIGDLASVRSDGKPVPGVAPAAKQMGRVAADNIVARIGHQPTRPFRYRDYGSLATIGRAAAVAQVGGMKLWGLPAWLFWLFVHIFFLIGFRNRLVVLFDWAWAYWTFERSARIVADPHPRDSG
ncbi:MAG TPA: NAD(P)/FAD-dependent oxidoreductase [Burkholderiaceae bacterium]|nr:NAD(P)/FAD-dependent oxidoreductase [Burkholderiaceae bacterium]